MIDATPARHPERVRLEGKLVRLEPLDPAKHGPALWQAVGGPENEYLWQFLFAGPFADEKSFFEYLKARSQSRDPLFFAIVDRVEGAAAGFASYMRVEQQHRVIEVGSILFAPQLQKTAGATEAMYLMARHAFEDLHYRRYEWKCNALHTGSRKAALRLGFQFEGIFRQHMIVKGRNRDTAWFSMLDSEWPQRKAAFETWLDEGNFDAQGKQKVPLSAMNGT